jgi:hypothetical protein
LKGVWAIRQDCDELQQLQQPDHRQYGGHHEGTFYDGG